MHFVRSVASLALGLTVVAGYAQTSQTTPQTPSPKTQGVGDQRGAGTSPDNSSNGGYGTRRHNHRHKRSTTKAGSATQDTAAPAPTPQQ